MVKNELSPLISNLTYFLHLFFFFLTNFKFYADLKTNCIKYLKCDHNVHKKFDLLQSYAER